MTWFGWLIMSYFMLGSLLSVALIGQPREPLSPGTATFILVMNGLLILGILSVGTGCP